MSRSVTPLRSLGSQLFVRELFNSSDVNLQSNVVRDEAAPNKIASRERDFVLLVRCAQSYSCASGSDPVSKKGGMLLQYRTHLALIV